MSEKDKKITDEGSSELKPTGDASIDELAKSLPPVKVVLNTMRPVSNAPTVTVNEPRIDTKLIAPVADSVPNKCTLPVIQNKDMFAIPYVSKFVSKLVIIPSPSADYNLYRVDDSLEKFYNKKTFLKAVHLKFCEIFKRYFNIIRDVPDQVDETPLAIQLFNPTEYKSIGYDVNAFVSDLKQTATTRGANMPLVKGITNVNIKPLQIQKKVWCAMHPEEFGMMTFFQNIIQQTFTTEMQDYFKYMALFNSIQTVYPLNSAAYQGTMLPDYNKFLQIPPTPLSTMYADAFTQMRMLLYHTTYNLGMDLIKFESTDPNTISRAFATSQVSTNRSSPMNTVLTSLMGNIDFEIFYKIIACYPLSRHMCLGFADRSFSFSITQLLSLIIWPLFVPAILTDPDSENYRQAYIIIHLFSMFKSSNNVTDMFGEVFWAARGNVTQPADMPFPYFFLNNGAQLLNPNVRSSFQAFFQYDYDGGGSISLGSYLNPQDWSTDILRSKYSSSPVHYPFAGFSDGTATYLNSDQNRRTYIFEAFNNLVSALSNKPNSSSYDAVRYQCIVTFLSLIRTRASYNYYGDRMDYLTTWLSQLNYAHEIDIHALYSRNTLIIPNDVNYTSPYAITSWTASQDVWTRGLINDRTIINVDPTVLIPGLRINWDKCVCNKVMQKALNTGTDLNNILWWIGGCFYTTLLTIPPIAVRQGTNNQLQAGVQSINYFDFSEIYEMAWAMFDMTYESKSPMIKYVKNMMDEQYKQTKLYPFIKNQQFFDAVGKQIMKYINDNPTFFNYIPYFNYGHPTTQVQPLMRNGVLNYINVYNRPDVYRDVVSDIDIYLNYVRFAGDSDAYRAILNGEKIRIDLPLPLNVPTEAEFDKAKICKDLLVLKPDQLEGHGSICIQPLDIQFVWQDTINMQNWPTFPNLPTMWTDFMPWTLLEDNLLTPFMKTIDVWTKRIRFLPLGDGMLYGVNQMRPTT